MPNESIIQVPPRAASLEAIRHFLGTIPGSATSLALYHSPAFDDAASALNSSGQKIAAIVESLPLIDPRRPDLFDVGYPAWCDALNAARPLAIPLVIGPLAESAARHDDLFHFAVESLRKIRFDAERNAARLALRAGPALALSEDDLRELIDEANSYWIGLEFDLASYPSPARAADALALLTHRVIAVRLHNPTPLQLAEAQSLLADLRLDAPILIDSAPSNEPTR